VPSVEGFISTKSRNAELRIAFPNVWSRLHSLWGSSMLKQITVSAAFGALALISSTPVYAAATCAADFGKLTQALKASVKASGGPGNGGLDNNEWGAVIARDGTVCAVTRTGLQVGDQWLGSRTIAIEKANTANALSLPKFAISTANLYAAVQPGGSLFGLIQTNPPAISNLYAGLPDSWGTDQDPMVGRPASGVVAFGGGLALYDSSQHLVGALGVSGDTSCADVNIAWRVRHNLGLDHVPGGVTQKHNDAIVYDIGANGKSSSGWGHPKCGGQEETIAQQIGASAAGTAAK
jgi:uncharacterized protein GlcG (DUF336 family)